jgi:two-component system chemotaxis response regulator CheB
VPPPGGVAALRALASMLPQDFKASVFVVLHISPSSPSRMPEILSKAGKLNATNPVDGEKIRPGRIYVAPPDYQMLIEKDRILIKRGPKENKARPSIDALFRSAAYSFGPRVMGVVLSGTLDDGTSGLWSIKRMGGTCIVQIPWMLNILKCLQMQLNTSR